MTLRSFFFCCLLFLVQHNAYAQEPLASEASVRELMVVMDTQKMMDEMWTQVDMVVQSSMKQTMAGQEVTPAQQAVLDDMRKELVALMSEELSWTTFEPMMLDIYCKTFTESEVQGMIQFYKSPTGQAVIAKMPVVMQAGMQAAQGRMASLQPKLRKLMEESVSKMKAASTQQTGT